MATIPRPPLVTTLAELREFVAARRRAGARVGLVPTMGALHEGHLSLVRASQAECALTVVSIYVNPTQFGPQEDFGRYPRMLDADLDALATCGAGLLVFAPPNAEIYRPGHAAWVEVTGVSEPLEGQCRPGHFRGVTTVVLKLLNMVGPDVAYFGQKDYQQALVIRRMVEDLDLPVAVRVCPTVREPDGLAMSSRNRYLAPDARRRALALWTSLCLADELVRQGERSARAITAQMGEILAVAGATIDYATLVDPETLQPVETIAGGTLAAIAARIDNTRLINNRLLEPSPDANKGWSGEGKNAK